MVQKKSMGFQTTVRVKAVGRSATTGRFTSVEVAGKPLQPAKPKQRPSIIEAAERAEKRLKGSMRILA